MREVETMEHLDDEFDALLRSALADRPEPATQTDFAARAMATAGPVVVERPHRVSIWPSVLAGVGIVVVALFGLLRIQEISSDWVTDSSFSESTSFETSTLLTFGAIGLVFSVVWIVCRSAFVRSEADLTLTLA
jgi:hypothetical protein